MKGGTTRFAGSRPGLLEVLQALTSTGPGIPSQEIWDQYMLARASYLLDPVALAIDAGDPRSIELALHAAGVEANQLQRPVDRGSAVLDLWLNGMGVRTNLSGLRTPSKVVYPIEPGVEYRRQFKEPQRGVGQGVMAEYINLDRTPMMDWDLPGPDHKARNVTVRHLGDVEELVRGYVADRPESTIRLYQTPGGYRAWEMSERMGPDEFQPSFEQLNVDGDYARMSTNASRQQINGVPVDGPGFRSRISHKPGRVDWVAQPLTTITGSRALPHPESVRQVETYHDEPIRRGYLQQGGVSPDAMEALKRQLPTASEAMRRDLGRRFGI